MRTRLGENFRPSTQFKSLYCIYLGLGILVCVLPWFVPMALFAPSFLTVLLLIPTLLVFVLAVYWIPKYYDSMRYSLTETEVIWSRGVWFRKTGIVPYSRITNIDVTQGPISRALGIASLRIQTAGYSSQAAPFEEIRIEGVENSEELKDRIMNHVRGKRPVATETYGQEDVNSRILDELTKIRELLEKNRP